MSDIFVNIIMGILILIGILPTVYCVVAFPAVIIWKIYRKIKHGYSLYD